jgi:hypothetical protein
MIFHLKGTLSRYSFAWVKKFGIDIVADEIEKGRELGKTDSFGVGFVAFGEAVQEG